MAMVTAERGVEEKKSGEGERKQPFLQGLWKGRPMLYLHDVALRTFRVLLACFTLKETELRGLIELIKV